jgi:hypothetical protein
MASVLTTLSTATSAISALSNLLVVSPQTTVGYQPQKFGSTAAVGQALLFHYEAENTVNLQFDITDHFAEDNQALQDQAISKPVEITTHGFIGELNDVAPFGLQTAQVLANKLLTIGAYVPSLSATALIAYNEAAFLYATAESAASSVIQSANSLGNFITGGNLGGQNVVGTTGTISNTPGQNKQQLAFQQFYANAQALNLFTVQTPWAVFQNMMIKSMRAIQDETTNSITDFELTFKQVRIASTTTASGYSLQTRAATQAAAMTNQGSSALSSASVSPFPFGGAATGALAGVS